MFINQLFENGGRRIVVIYGGRFQPWHRGHAQVYDYLVKKYGSDNTFIATSNKVDPPKSPFDFNDKVRMITATGVSQNKVVQSVQPYVAKEITVNYNPETDILLFAVSEKDMAEDPRFAFKPKKDGSPSYFQPLKDLSQCESFGKHGYIMTVPTFTFNVLGKPVTGATQIRAMFIEGDEQTRKQIVTELYGKFDQGIYALLTQKLVGVNEAKVDGRAKIVSYKDRNGVTKYEVLNADGVRVEGDLSKEIAQEYLRAHRSELQESATPDKKIASLQKKYDSLKDRCDMAKDKRRMKGQRLLSQAEMKYMRQMSDINQQIHLLKAESMKPTTVTESMVTSADLANIIADRIEYRYPDLYTRYGLEVVGDAIQDIAEFHAGDLEELGTSDIGGMVREVIRRLESGADLGESAVKYSARETKDGTWRVFKQGESVSVAGPFDSADEASQWIKDHSSVNEGIFDRFKTAKKPVAVPRPDHYPRLHAVNEWMEQVVEFRKKWRPDDLWMLFCPSSGDYIPMRVIAGTSELTFKAHEKHYIKLRDSNPEAASKAKRNYLEYSYFSGGPSDDYITEGWKETTAAVASAAALGAAVHAGGEIDKQHTPRIDVDGQSAYVVTDPQRAQNREGVRKVIDGKPHKVWVEKGQTYAVPINEAKSISKHVKIVAGPAKGKTGWIGEVRHGAFKGAPKEYTIDLDGGGNVRCSAKELRLIKDEQVNEATKEKLLRKFVPGQAKKQIDNKIKDQQFTQIMAKDNPSHPDAEKEIERSTKNIRRLSSIKNEQVDESSIQSWKKQAIKDHGEGLEFVKDKHGDGVVNRVFAKKDGKTVATYDRNRQAGTVFAPTNEASDYMRRRQREEDIISGKKPARKKKPAQTSDYAKRRAKEKANESAIAMRAIEEGVQNKAANKLIESMMTGARNGDMKVVAEHIEKLEAYLDCGVIDHIEKAIKVAKRNAG